MPIVNRVADLQPDIQAWRRDIHEHPELLYDVHRTAGFVADRLKEFGCDEIVTGLGKTGVVGVIKGKKPANGNAELTPGATVSVAVRPEKLELSPARPANGNAIAGRRQAEAYLGDRSHYYVAAEGLPKPIAAAAQNTRRNCGAAQAGEPVWVHWPIEAGVLLTR